MRKGDKESKTQYSEGKESKRKLSTKQVLMKKHIIKIKVDYIVITQISQVYRQNTII